MRLTSDSVLDGLPAGTSGVMNDYRRIVRRRLLLILLLALLIVASLLLDFMLGPSGLPLQNLWQTLTDPASADPGTHAIVWDIRLPYAVMAIIVGLALGLAGAEMQTILNNPLASPFTPAFLGCGVWRRAGDCARYWPARYSRPVVYLGQRLYLRPAGCPAAGRHHPLDPGGHLRRHSVRHRAGLYL